MPDLTTRLVILEPPADARRRPGVGTLVGRADRVPRLPGQPDGYTVVDLTTADSFEERSEHDKFIRSCSKALSACGIPCAWSHDGGPWHHVGPGGRCLTGQKATLRTSRADPVPVAGSGTGGHGPVLCDAMILPDDATAEQRRGWILHADKCMEPATLVMGFSCTEGHAGQNLKCDLHGQDDGKQWCGYCAEAGQRVPAKVQIVRRL